MELRPWVEITDGYDTCFDDELTQNLLEALKHLPNSILHLAFEINTYGAIVLKGSQFTQRLGLIDWQALDDLLCPGGYGELQSVTFGFERSTLRPRDEYLRDEHIETEMPGLENKGVLRFWWERGHRHPYQWTCRGLGDASDGEQ